MGIASSLIDRALATPHKAAQGLLDVLKSEGRQQVKMHSRSARNIYKYSGAQELVEGAARYRHPIRTLKADYNSPMQMGTIQTPGGGAGRAAEGMLKHGARPWHIAGADGKTLEQLAAGIKHPNVMVVKPKPGQKLYGGVENRLPVIIGADGKAYMAGQQGMHHHDVAKAAGLGDDWAKTGKYHQGDLFDYRHQGQAEPHMNIGGWMDGEYGRATQGHYTGAVSIREALSQAGHSTHAEDVLARGSNSHGSVVTKKQMSPAELDAWRKKNGIKARPNEEYIRNSRPPVRDTGPPLKPGKRLNLGAASKAPRSHVSPEQLVKGGWKVTGRKH